MRSLLILFMSLSLANHQVYGQTRRLTKLYLYNPYKDLQTVISPDNLLDIGSKGRVGYALIETDLDSLGLKDPTGHDIYLLLEPGKTYYYGYDHDSIAYREMSPNTFWLSVATSNKYYRHYSITKKSGVVKLE